MSYEKVSIIIPIHNTEKYLNKCLDSIVSQTFSNIEIICIDDGSNDSSLNILKDYSKKDNRIKIFEQSNKGVNDARNMGIDKATGKYILFLDADDWIELSTIEKLYMNAELYNSELVLFNYAEEYDNNVSVTKMYPINFENKNSEEFTFNYSVNKDLVFNSFLTIWSKFYLTSFIKENNLKFNSKIYDESLFHIHVMIQAKLISYVPEILYHYRKSNFSLSNSTFNFDDVVNSLKIIDDIEIFLMKEDKLNELKINFVSFKIKHYKNIFDSVESDNISLLADIKKEFEHMDLSLSILKELDNNLRMFYLNIIFQNELNYISNQNILDNLSSIQYESKIIQENIKFLHEKQSDLENSFNDNYVLSNEVLLEKNRLFDEIESKDYQIINLNKENQELKEKIEEQTIKVNQLKNQVFSVNEEIKNKDKKIFSLSDQNIKIKQKYLKKDEQTRYLITIINQMRVDDLNRIKSFENKVLNNE